MRSEKDEEVHKEEDHPQHHEVNSGDLHPIERKPEVNDHTIPENDRLLANPDHHESKMPLMQTFASKFINEEAKKIHHENEDDSKHKDEEKKSPGKILKMDRSDSESEEIKVHHEQLIEEIQRPEIKVVDNSKSETKFQRWSNTAKDYIQNNKKAVTAAGVATGVAVTALLAVIGFKKRRH